MTDEFIRRNAYGAPALMAVMVIRIDWIALASMALLAALTSGCTTALRYKPDEPGSPTSGGYSEMQFSPDHFHITIPTMRGGRVRVTCLSGYDDWREYWKVFRIGAGVKRAAEPAWRLANPNHSCFQRDELNFEIELSSSLGKDIFEAAKFIREK